MAGGADGCASWRAGSGDAAGRRGWTSCYAYSERRTRAAIAGCPTARYRGRGRDRGRRHPRARHPDPGRGADRRRRAAWSTSPAPRPQQPGNVNCPLAVTRSAVYYVRAGGLRSRHPGVRRRLRAGRRCVAPEGCLVNARPPGAVVAGNTETSSRIVDVVMSALGRRGRRAGARPGDDEQRHLRHARGSPTTRRSAAARAARPAGPGPSGVHVAMSNTLNTPIEALEREYPLRIERYALRPRHRRRRPPPRRRRRRARLPRARGLPPRAHDRAPPPRPARRRGRRRRRAGRATA